MVVVEEMVKAVAVEPRMNRSVHSLLLTRFPTQLLGREETEVGGPLAQAATAGFLLLWEGGHTWLTF